MKKQCVLILPYFGKFNNYFPLFLRSCAANPSYDFLILRIPWNHTSTPPMCMWCQ